MMKRETKLPKSRPLITFFLLTFAITWGLAALAIFLPVFVLFSPCLSILIWSQLRVRRWQNEVPGPSLRYQNVAGSEQTGAVSERSGR
jgi:hypothetical protein